MKFWYLLHRLAVNVQSHLSLYCLHMQSINFKCFFLFLFSETFVVGTHRNGLYEANPMPTDKFAFLESLGRLENPTWVLW